MQLHFGVRLPGIDESEADSTNTQLWFGLSCVADAPHNDRIQDHRIVSIHDAVVVIHGVGFPITTNEDLLQRLRQRLANDPAWRDQIERQAEMEYRREVERIKELAETLR